MREHAILGLASVDKLPAEAEGPGFSRARLAGVRGAGVEIVLSAELEQAGLSVSTRRLVHAVLHGALRDAVRWGKLTRNPADMADPPSRGGSRVQAWTAGELRRFLEHVATDRLVALWRLAATTGMRRGELAGVTWRALDLDGARLSVDQQGADPGRRDVRPAQVGP